MKFFVVALIGFLAGQSAAELENVSINTEGDMLEVTAEDLVKRDYDNGFKPKVYARSNNNQFGGGLYELEEQKLLLEAHNDYRKQVNPSASNMDEMVSSICSWSLFKFYVIYLMSHIWFNFNHGIQFIHAPYLRLC